MTDINDLLTRLVHNTVSKFEVVFEINKRKINYSQNEDFVLLKLYLQIDVAKELLANNGGTEEQKFRYEEILRNSEGHLKEIESKKSDRSYSCQVSGCPFKNNTYREFLRHLRKYHSGLNQLRCNFQKVCPRIFANIEQLENHYKSAHTRESRNFIENSPRLLARTAEIRCQCSFAGCRGKEFHNIAGLTNHINVVHKKDRRLCIFAGCKRNFKPNVDSRHHFRDHCNKGNSDLKEKNLLKVGGVDESSLTHQNNAGDLDVFEEVEEVEEAQNDLENDGYDSEEEDSFEQALEHALFSYAQFLNEIGNVDCIPSKTVTKISSQYYKLAKMSQTFREKYLLKMMKRKFPGIDFKELEAVHRDLIDRDPFMKAQELLGSVSKKII